MFLLLFMMKYEKKGEHHHLCVKLLSIRYRLVSVASTSDTINFCTIEFCLKKIEATISLI